MLKIDKMANSISSLRLNILRIINKKVDRYNCCIINLNSPSEKEYKSLLNFENFEKEKKRKRGYTLGPRLYTERHP